VAEGDGEERTAGATRAVFISYASQDLVAARCICDALRAVGVEVWFDQSDLRGGDAWDAAIRKQVKKCALFLPLISVNTDTRSEGYFRRELALLCVQDYAQGFNLQTDALEKGLAAAQRAVEVAPSNHLSHYGLAQALFFLKEFQSFRNAAERAVALNPMDGNALAFLGELLSYSGDCERGAALAARAKQLNPNHPGFYWFADFYNAYRQQDYRSALAAALNLNLRGHMGAHMVLAATYGQLGEREAAEKAVRDLLKLRPDFASIARGLLGQWWIPEYVEQLIDGWRKAGLEIAPANAAVTRP